MTKQSPENKSIVKEGDKATIVCPECDSNKTVAVGQFRHRQHSLKVKCKCGHTFRVQLEFRRDIRKELELEGVFDFTDPSRRGGRTTIVNLSLSGACFEVRGKHDLQVGQKGSLVFTLDNRKQSVLIKKVIVKSVVGNKIGCEFVKDKAFDTDLGFYLRP